MLKGSSAMPRLSRKGLVVASLSTLGLASPVARAQTTTTTTTGVATPCVATPGGQPTVSVSGQQTVPNRIVNGVNVGTSTRPAALNPNGVSYQDCIEDMALQFPVTACNFSGQNLQIWASRSSDCTSPTDRGIGGVAVCWLVSQGDTGLILSQNGRSYTIRVQDIVGPQNVNPSPTTMSAQGVSACSAQSTYLAVPININFIPINPGDGSTAGPAYEYTLSTDLVGPPAPAGVGIKDGDTLFVVKWTPNIDTDTGGYDVVIDPIPGMEPPDATTTSSGAPTGATTELICPADSGASTSAGTALPAEGGDDGEATDSSPAEASAPVVSDGAPSGAAPSDAAPSGAAPSDAASFDAAPVTSAVDDAGCYLRTVAGSGASGSGNGGTCNDSLLTGGTLTDGGTDAEVAAPEEFDDAGNLIVSDAGLSTATGAGGIWVPPLGQVVNPNPTLGITATGETNSTYTITGLRNGTTYNVVVASVDNFGNVGPPSTQACDFPAPVNDFWKIYRTDGGQAGGGFCALEAVGAPATTSVAFAGAGALVIAGLRRRRSKRR
jgi:hypothetical protein